MLTTVEKVLVLKSIDLFSQLPGEDLAKIALITEEIFHEAGHPIFEEGDIGDSLYLIVHGEVRVHSQGRTLVVLKDKDCFGEMAILDHEPRSAGVSALSDVSLLRISHDDFYDILADKIEIARGIFKVLSMRLRDMNVRLQQASSKPDGD